MREVKATRLNLTRRDLCVSAAHVGYFVSYCHHRFWLHAKSRLYRRAPFSKQQTRIAVQEEIPYDKCVLDPAYLQAGTHGFR